MPLSMIGNVWIYLTKKSVYWKSTKGGKGGGGGETRYYNIKYQNVTILSYYCIIYNIKR